MGRGTSRRSGEARQGPAASLAAGLWQRDCATPPAAEMPMGEALEVVAGAVVAYRLYDIAYAIDLAKVEAVWARRAGPGSRRGRLAAPPPKAGAVGGAPGGPGLGPPAPPP